jgi:hypothetical protein
MTDEITAEQIAQHYSAAMDSVNLLNAGQPEGMDDDRVGGLCVPQRRASEDHGGQGLLDDRRPDPVQRCHCG